MGAREIAAELKSLGVETAGLFEKRALAERLASARREEAIRATVEASRERRHAGRSLELRRAQQLSDPELRAILVGRGVPEADDPCVPVPLLAALLAELRLAEQPQEVVDVGGAVLDRARAFVVESGVLNTAADAVAQLGRSVAAAAQRAAPQTKRRRSVVLPFVFNRLFAGVLDVGEWAGGGIVDKRVVAAVATLAAFTTHGLKASLACLLLTRLITGLFQQQPPPPSSSY